jgi:iron complex outermembrane receptor protein
VRYNYLNRATGGYPISRQYNRILRRQARYGVAVTWMSMRKNKHSLVMNTAGFVAVVLMGVLTHSGLALCVPLDADAATAGGSDALGEVTVTAQRVQQDLQKTPISITALSNQQLQQLNVSSTSDLRGLVPNLEILQQSGGGAGTYGENEMGVYIRGVGTESRFFNQDLGVGIYVDDVYLTTTQNLNLSFYDLGDVQVLKGPQGTLFGKNTIGGALLLQTTKPGAEFGGYGQVTFGSFNRLDVQGAVNLPFSDILLSRLSFYTSDVDGYITHLLDSGTNDDVHEKSVRYQLRFQPTEGFTADLLTEYGESHDHGYESITTQCNPNAYYTGNYDSVHTIPYCTQYKPLGQPYEIYGNAVAKFPTGGGGFTPFDQGKSGTVDLRLAWTINDNITLKSISALKRLDLDSYRDDGTPAGLYTELMDYADRQISQEFQALSKFWDGRLNLVAGVFYIDQKANSQQITGPDYVDPVGYYFGNIIDSTSVAAYLQGTYKITDQLSATVGVRYTRDHKDSSSNVYEGCYGSYLSEYITGTGGCWIPGPGSADYAAASGTWTHTDPRFQLDYQWTPTLMTYVSATSGYKSGGFNAQLPYLGSPYNLPFQEESVWNYEIGAKSEWFDRRLRANIAVFDQEYKNFQSSVQEYYNGIDVFTTTSAADGFQRGAELEIDAIPTPDLTVRATYAYLDQGYSKIFPDAAAAGLTLNTPITTAPKNEYSIAADYTVHLPGGATLIPALNWRYVGPKSEGTPPETAVTPGYGLLGANLAYNAPSQKWSIALWGKNLLNKYYYVDYSAGADTNMGITQVTPGRPREIGGTVRYNFN